MSLYVRVFVCVWDGVRKNVISISRSICVFLPLVDVVIFFGVHSFIDFTVFCLSQFWFEEFTIVLCSASHRAVIFSSLYGLCESSFISMWDSAFVLYSLFIFLFHRNGRKKYRWTLEWLLTHIILCDVSGGGSSIKIEYKCGTPYNADRRCIYSSYYTNSAISICEV